MYLFFQRYPLHNVKTLCESYAPESIYYIYHMKQTMTTENQKL